MSNIFRSDIEKEVDQLVRTSEGVADYLIQAVNSGIKNAWENEDFTIVELFQQDAVKMSQLFKHHGDLANFIRTTSPADANKLLSVSDFGTFQPNVDGTITILTYKRNGQWFDGQGNAINT